MKTVLNWITSNPIAAFVILVVVIALVVFIYLNKKNLLRKAALYAVAVAEDQWSSGTGKIKFAEVYAYLKQRFPLFTLFFSEAKLAKIIEDALEELREILEGDTEEAEIEEYKTITEDESEDTPEELVAVEEETYE